MSNLPLDFEPNEQRRRIAGAHLKRCPLCASLNAASNEECFVCAWHGTFDHDPLRIEASLIQLMLSCPDYRR